MNRGYADMTEIEEMTRPLGSLFQDYEVMEVLGKGSYGKVYKARRRADGYLCVIKQVGLEGISQKEKEDALNEVSHSA